MRNNQGDPEVIGKTVERILAQMGAPPANTLVNLDARWSEIVGPALAGPTHPIELINGVLVIGCDDATWASQIGWMEGQIKRRFSAVFEGVSIHRIQVRTTP